MSLPVRAKPYVDMDYANSVITYPNVIDVATMERLREYATNQPDSGLHRRGSKNPESIKAAFSTCLVHNTNDEIYKILSPIWDRYIEEHPCNLSFIEPYEIKIYYEGDYFGYHQDSYGSIKSDIDRKLNLVIQLSDPKDYVGGSLCVGHIECPKMRGTAIFFPAHYNHYVTKVTSGSRCIIIGHAWGPLSK